MNREKNKNENGGRARSGMAIDIVAMPGLVAFRLRETPQEPIYTFSTADARKFARELLNMIQHAELLGRSVEYAGGQAESDRVL